MLRCAILIVLCIVCAIKDNRTSHTPNYIWASGGERQSVYIVRTCLLEEVLSIRNSWRFGGGWGIKARAAQCRPCKGKVGIRVIGLPPPCPPSSIPLSLQRKLLQLLLGRMQWLQRTRLEGPMGSKCWLETQGRPPNPNHLASAVS